jgi:hypothetical protein
VATQQKAHASRRLLSPPSSTFAWRVALLPSAPAAPPPPYERHPPLWLVAPRARGMSPYTHGVGFRLTQDAEAGLHPTTHTTTSSRGGGS